MIMAGDGLAAEVCKESVPVGKAWRDFKWVAAHQDESMSVCWFQPTSAEF